MVGIPEKIHKKNFPPDGGSHVKSSDPNVCANVAASKTGHTSDLRKLLKMHSMYLRADGSFSLTARKPSASRC